MLENEYYTAIKGLIINSEVNKSVKNYFINKSDLKLNIILVNYLAKLVNIMVKVLLKNML